VLLVLTRCSKIGAVLSADVFARYSRLRGGEEFFFFFFFFLVHLFQLCCLKDGTLCSFAELTSMELRQKCSRESEVSHPEKFATSFTRFFFALFGCFVVLKILWQRFTRKFTIGLEFLLTFGEEPRRSNTQRLLKVAFCPCSLVF
jgi:hypothetical protein